MAKKNIRQNILFVLSLTAVIIGSAEMSLFNTKAQDLTENDIFLEYVSRYPYLEPGTYQTSEYSSDEIAWCGHAGVLASTVTDFQYDGKNECLMVYVADRKSYNSDYSGHSIHLAVLSEINGKCVPTYDLDLGTFDNVLNTEIHLYLIPGAKEKYIVVDEKWYDDEINGQYQVLHVNESGKIVMDLELSALDEDLDQALNSYEISLEKEMSYNKSYWTIKPDEKMEELASIIESSTILENSRNFSYSFNIYSTKIEQSGVKDYIRLMDLPASMIFPGEPKLVNFKIVRDNTGMEYKNGIGGSGSNSYTDCHINGKYARMEGAFVLNFDSREITDEPVAEIYGDGDLLFRSKPVTIGVLPQYFSLDIRGIQNIKICIDGKNAIRLVDCVFSENPEIYGDYSTAVRRTFESEKGSLYIANLKWSHSSFDLGGIVTYTDVYDNHGNYYPVALGGYETDRENWNEYDLNGEYDYLSGTVFLDEKSYNKESDVTRVSFYGDEKLLFTSDLITEGVPPQYFLVKLSGVRKLKVVIYGANLARLGDCILISATEKN